MEKKYFSVCKGELINKLCICYYSAILSLTAVRYVHVYFFGSQGYSAIYIKQISGPL